MNIGLSLYLDLLRFSLAAQVVLAHASYRLYTGDAFAGFAWHFYRYAQTSVIGFFVLSGFVIAYVASHNEARPWAYTSARIARLYSVVIPALILTALLDGAGHLIDPGWYTMPGPVTLKSDEPLRYLLTLFFLNDIDGVTAFTGPNMIPGTNVPFWSLSFEAAYYLAFGLILFARSWMRVIGLLVLAVVAGATVTALFGVWLLGVAAFHWGRRLVIPMPLAGIVFLASIAGIAAVGVDARSGRFKKHRGVLAVLAADLPRCCRRASVRPQHYCRKFAGSPFCGPARPAQPINPLARDANLFGLSDT